MDRLAQKLYELAPQLREKTGDDELYDLLMRAAERLGHADMLKHQLGYLLMHARSTVAAPSRPKHFQDALARAEAFLNKYEEGNQAD